MCLGECAALVSFQIVDDRPGGREWFIPGEHLVTSSDHVRFAAEGAALPGA